MANTPFLNLVKPTDTDQALITDINNNSDKIDTGVSTLSEQIVSSTVGTDVSLSEIESALDTLGASMKDGDVKSIDFSVSPASGVFTLGRNFGFIRRITNTRYLVLVQRAQGSGTSASKGEVITGYKYNGPWQWESLSEHISTQSISSGDFNTLTGTPGKMIRYGAENIQNFSNRPSGVATNQFPFTLEVFYVGTTSTYPKQILHVYGGTPDVYVRQKYYTGGQNVWCEWKKYAFA